MLSYDDYKRDYDAYIKAENQAKRIRPHAHNFVGQFTFHELARIGLSVIKQVEELRTPPQQKDNENE